MADPAELQKLILEYQRVEALPATKETVTQLNKLAERIGELGAEIAIEREYGSKIVSKMAIPRRGAQGAPILDLAYELQNRQRLVVEAKFNTSRRGRVNEKVFAAGDEFGSGAVESLTLKQQVEQLEGRWIKDRIGEIGKQDKALANGFDAALNSGQLTVVEARTTLRIEGGKVTGVHVGFVDETENVQKYVNSGRAGSGITDAQRALAKKEAFLRKETASAKSQAHVLDREAQSAEKAAAKAKRAADAAAKSAKEAKRPQTVAKRGQIAAEKLKQANKLEADARAARQVADTAAGKLASTQKELEKNQQSLRELSETKRTIKAPSKVVTIELPSVQAKTLERAVESNAAAARAIEAKGLERTAVEARGAERALVGLEKALSTEQKAAKLIRVVAITRNLGRFVIHLFIPTTLLDLAFFIALEIYEWYQRKKIEEAKEWNRIINFLLGEPAPVDARFIDKAGQPSDLDERGRYSQGIGPLVRGLVDQSLSDEKNARNFVYFLDQWNTQPNWPGFVYAKVAAVLEHQYIASSSYKEPFEHRYFLLNRDPTVSFRTSTTVDTNGKVETPLPKGDYPNVYYVKSDRDKTPLANYADPTIVAIINYTVVDLKYTISSPVLTPFDFIIFKCRSLIVDILQFISKYDPFFVNQPAFYETTFWEIYWYEGTTFPYPIYTPYAHYCIKSLRWAIGVLSQHTAKAGDTPDAGKERRHKILEELVPPNSTKRPLYDIALKLNMIAQDLREDLLAKPVDPELSYLTNEYLFNEAIDIEKDLKRAYAALMSPNKHLSWLYRYAGNPEEEE